MIGSLQVKFESETSRIQSSLEVRSNKVSPNITVEGLALLLHTHNVSGF